MKRLIRKKHNKDTFPISLLKARVNMFISLPGTSELERKMACKIIENVLESTDITPTYELGTSEYNRKYT